MAVTWTKVPISNWLRLTIWNEAGESEAQAQLPVESSEDNDRRPHVFEQGDSHSVPAGNIAVRC